MARHQKEEMHMTYLFVILINHLSDLGNSTYKVEYPCYVIKYTYFNLF